MSKEINKGINSRWGLRILGAIVVIIAAAITIYYVSFRGAVSTIELKKDKIEAGTKVKDFNKLIKFSSSTPDIFEVEPVNADKINLNKPGKCKIIYSIKRVDDGYTKKEKVELEIVDTKKPKITAKEPVTYLGEEMNLLEALKVKDNAEGQLMAEITEGEVDVNKLGDYKVKVKVWDESGNEQIKKTIISVRLSVKQYFEKIITDDGGWVCSDEDKVYQFYIGKKGKKICAITTKNYYGEYEINDIALSDDGDSMVVKMRLFDYDKKLAQIPPNDKKKFKIKISLRGDKGINAGISDYRWGSYMEVQSAKKYSESKLDKYYKKKGF